MTKRKMNRIPAALSGIRSYLRDMTVLLCFTIMESSAAWAATARRRMHISWCVFQKKPIMLILPEKIPSGPQLLRRLMRQKAATS